MPAVHWEPGMGVPMTSSDFEGFFRAASHPERAPYAWQLELGADSTCRDRLIRIPTGFGKTAGVVLTWLFHRVQRADHAWPMRLVFTLPMRVLVEQTVREVSDWLARLGLGDNVGLHLLMGGAEAGEFHLTPERPAILIGTQDMLVSRALNRGFAARRARWPIDFGLLHHDALWVLDEVQLMDVALATSAQLAGFRVAEAPRALRPAHTWWMSATLQPDWLRTIDWRARVTELEAASVRIAASERSGGLWDVKKQLECRPDVSEPAELAALALAHSAAHPGRLVLVVVNTVDRARETMEALRKATTEAVGKGKTKTTQKMAGAPDLRLVHSRFRGADRARWPDEFLSRDAAIPPEGRIIVATQVVEAGVDISAAALITDLAPWPSLVQRFGRAARYVGESGIVTVVGTPPNDPKKARPYDLEQLTSAANALDRLDDVSPATLESFEDRLRSDEPARLGALYPYRPEHVLRRGDLVDLFDTTPDLTGADLDISRWVRSNDGTDVTLFWRPISVGADLPGEIHPRQVGRIARAELCPAPIGDVREWVDKDVHKREGEKRCSVYVLDYVDDVWRKVARVLPGMTLMVPSDAGGYGPLGFDEKAKTEVSPTPAEAVLTPPDRMSDLLEEACGGADNDDLSAGAWQTIATHGREVGAIARSFATSLGLDERTTYLLGLAGRWHDVGKAHDAFQAKLEQSEREKVGDFALGCEVAKAPPEAWKTGRHATPRRGFRHELASTLALFELVRLADPWHAWLLGGVREVLAALGDTPSVHGDRRLGDHALARELVALEAHELDLVAYLVLSHHGKLRTAISASPLDQGQERVNDQGRGAQPIAGVLEGDALPEVGVIDREGGEQRLPALELSLDLAAMGLGTRFGESWGERVSGLVARHGPFALAYLEALLRAADVRASKEVGV